MSTKAAEIWILTIILTLMLTWSKLSPKSNRFLLVTQHTTLKISSKFVNTFSSNPAKQIYITNGQMPGESYPPWWRPVLFHRYSTLQEWITALCTPVTNYRKWHTVTTSLRFLLQYHLFFDKFQQVITWQCLQLQQTTIQLVSCIAVKVSN